MTIIPVIWRLSNTKFPSETMTSTERRTLCLKLYGDLMAPRQRCYSTYLARSLYLSVMIWPCTKSFFDVIKRTSATWRASSCEMFFTLSSLDLFSLSLTLLAFCIFFFRLYSKYWQMLIASQPFRNVGTLIKLLHFEDAHHLPQKLSHCLYI